MQLSHKDTLHFSEILQEHTYVFPSAFQCCSSNRQTWTMMLLPIHFNLCAELKYKGQRKNNGAYSIQEVQCFTTDSGNEIHNKLLCTVWRASSSISFLVVVVVVRKDMLTSLPYMHFDVLHNLEYKFRRKALGNHTLPSKIVSLLRNSQNEGVFHNPQRSRRTRKHKCIHSSCPSFLLPIPSSRFLPQQRSSRSSSSAIL